jgi:hypothetical protein
MELEPPGLGRAVHYGSKVAIYGKASQEQQHT